MAEATLFVGLISGTSVDGIDAALVRFDGEIPRLLSGLTHPWPEPLRQRILELSQRADGLVGLDDYGQLDVAIGQSFAAATQALLKQAGISASAVRAIGSHGQTMRHRPQGPQPFTLQIGDPAVIAETCDIDVVADFRRADVAAGGQGAPLLPILHARLLGRSGCTTVVANLGGIANITIIHADGRVQGFDTGPANGLLDAWFHRHHPGHYDHDGLFAASGRVRQDLLQDMLQDPYFAAPPPKSTGREYFQLAWLERHTLTGCSAEDIQASLLELTARSLGDAIRAHAPAAEQVWLCGGGIHNPLLVQRIAACLPGISVDTTAAAGIDPDYIEAIAFAWLARQRLLGRPGNLPQVTGARGLRQLGAIYPRPDHFI
ncbi:anhydro-N-acetylmuramic acid kinase [Frateuria aurantia]|uniref:Anhydro-N-acetylmuramic acid kinase n=1 Tax=Frateuria aurantia (strain ATCC 33424 / DSM 6220 / KCTC 2777 / LMG 1558 / NBRC 3245 / NCIMB 13370) TaxID=767434 RepID=H8KZ57_FRAAD|nr:anhydro-N-acetylmuramic acid kinase [Frateuria aurantia]AFC84548.1 molecular chaperone [Frateuria aurantia DSM 6220]